MKYPKTHTTHNSNRKLSHSFVSVVIARGKHPDPSRTRKLSLPALMVLHTRVCGRVRHRRTTHYPVPPHPTRDAGGTTTPTTQTNKTGISLSRAVTPQACAGEPGGIAPILFGEWCMGWNPAESPSCREPQPPPADAHEAVRSALEQSQLQEPC